MSARRPRALVAAAIAACIIGVLAGQAISDVAAPRGLDRNTGMSVGRAGSAFTEGLRVFAAVMIWNRLDPQVHDYYGNMPLQDMVWLVPNLRLVVLLDPDFQQAYYVLPWILGRNGRVSEGLEIAREGLEYNPHSGMLWASYAQILQVLAKDDDAAVGAAKRVLASDIVWSDPRLEYEGLKMAGGVFKANGMTAEATRVERLVEEVAREIEESGLQSKAQRARQRGSESEDPSW